MQLLCLFCLVFVAAFLAARGPAFPGALAPRAGAALDLCTGVAVSPAAALLAPPLAAQTAEVLPTPVLGIGMIFVIVLPVLIISGFAIDRGLMETIHDLRPSWSSWGEVPTFGRRRCQFCLGRGLPVDIGAAAAMRARSRGR